MRERPGWLTCLKWACCLIRTKDLIIIIVWTYTSVTNSKIIHHRGTEAQRHRGTEYTENFMFITDFTAVRNNNREHDAFWRTYCFAHG